MTTEKGSCSGPKGPEEPVPGSGRRPSCHRTFDSVGAQRPACIPASWHAPALICPSPICVPRPPPPASTGQGTGSPIPAPGPLPLSANLRVHMPPKSVRGEGHGHLVRLPTVTGHPVGATSRQTSDKVGPLPVSVGPASRRQSSPCYPASRPQVVSECPLCPQGEEAPWTKSSTAPVQASFANNPENLEKGGRTNVCTC